MCTFFSVRRGGARAGVCGCVSFCMRVSVRARGREMERERRGLCVVNQLLSGSCEEDADDQAHDNSYSRNRSTHGGAAATRWRSQVKGHHSRVRCGRRRATHLQLFPAAQVGNVVRPVESQ